MKFRFPLLSAAMLAAIGFIPRLIAQDVIVGAPGWFSSEGIPDEPPQTRHAVRPVYPEEMQTASESGYVIVSIYLTDRGQILTLGKEGTNPWLKDAVDKATADLEMHSAKHAGKPVPAYFWIPIIFNPASASPNRRDASPRLLAVTPVIAPAKVMKKLDEKTTIWGTVDLDSAGVPQKVILEAPASPKLLPYVETALKQWRFAPARQDGRPVAASLRTAFIVYSPADPTTAKMTLPRLIKQEQPIYPSAMAWSGIKAEVMVHFVVDKQGSVRDPVVSRSNNPAFNQPAIEAILKWKFEPCTVNGQPVNSRMAQQINFEPGFGAREHEAVAVDPASRRAQKNMPEEVRYDTPPKPSGYVNPVYPYSLLRDDRQGDATVAFAVDIKGKVTDMKVIAATQPEFGLALEAAVERLQFLPALKDGQPTQTVMKMEQEFHPYAEKGIGIPSEADMELLQREKKKPDTIVGARGLDHPLKPLSCQTPVFPLALRGKADHGEAMIEFLIDEQGRARLPRIIKASDPAFGYAAAQAVAEWRFAPPQAAGKPAVVRVMVPCEFESKPPAKKTAADPAPAAGRQD